MPIIGTLPNNIQNGQSVDANPVMADFNFIVNQVNANANPIGTLTAPSGTRTVFHQAAAPLGWTQDATITNHTIQVVGTAGGATGGSTGYSGMFQSQFSTDSFSLTATQLPVHNHVINISDPGHVHVVVDPGHTHGVNRDSNSGAFASSIAPVNNGISTVSTIAALTTVSTGVSLNPAATGISATSNNAGSGAAFSMTKTFNAMFVQMIMCSKT